MKCEKCRRWVSDDLDGSLPTKEKRAFRDHLDRCPACRRYAGDLKIIDAGARSREEARPPSGYWEDLSRRLDARLAGLAAGERDQGRLPAAGVIWGWSWAALVMAAFLGVYLFLAKPAAPPVDHVFSMEDALARIYLEIGDDAELENRFNLSLSASVAEALRDAGGEGGTRFPEEIIFWESLTDEDMRLIESGLRKGTT